MTIEEAIAKFASFIAFCENTGQDLDLSADRIALQAMEEKALRVRTEQAAPKTNFARLARSPEALAEFLLGAQKSDPALKWCVDGACFEHLDDEQFDCTDEMHTRCILKWLNKPEEEENGN